MITIHKELYYNDAKSALENLRFDVGDGISPDNLILTFKFTEDLKLFHMWLNGYNAGVEHAKAALAQIKAV